MKMWWLVLICLFLSACANNQAKRQTQAVSSIGDVFAKNGRLAEAEMYYAKAHALAPEQPQLLNKLANSQVQQGKLAEAKSSYQQLIKQNPKNKEARYRLASVAMSLGDGTLALTQYKTLLKNNKRDAKALNGLGVLLDNVHKNKFAQACYKRGLIYSPQNYSLLNNIGLSYALAGNVKEARRYLNKSTQKTTIERPKNNIKLVNEYYKKFKKSKVRVAKLNKDLLLDKLRPNKRLANEAISLALSTC
jgi:Flp pilus assembly protein TadD